MIRILIRKQWQEVFRNYHYNAKKGKARSKWGVLAAYAVYMLVMVGGMGALFTVLALGICEPFCAMGLDWLYFVLMGIAALMWGACGSAFSTYSMLYMAKDNDILFSLPIPVDAIMIARLCTVYLMGLMYSASACVPAAVVYWIKGHFMLPAVLGGLFMQLNVSVLVVIVSAALGYLIAVLSRKIRNKGILSLIVVSIFLGVYYTISFRVSNLFEAFAKMIIGYRVNLEKTFRVFSAFGRMCTGDLPALLICTAAVAAVLVLTWLVMRPGFLKLATSSAPSKSVNRKVKDEKPKSLAAALVGKEMSRFLSSTSYMLNCGLPILLLPAGGIALLIFANRLPTEMGKLIEAGVIEVLVCSMVCMLGALIGTAAPSVSLEGKNLWILRSLPVSGWEVLRAKIRLQLLFAEPVTLFMSLCAAFVMRTRYHASVLPLVLMMLAPAIYMVFLALWGMFWGLKLPNLQWTNENYPIKQGMAVGISLISGMVFAIGYVALFIWKAEVLGGVAYLSIFCGVFLMAALVLWRYLKTKGADKFENL